MLNAPLSLSRGMERRWRFSWRIWQLGSALAEGFPRPSHQTWEMAV